MRTMNYSTMRGLGFLCALIVTTAVFAVTGNAQSDGAVSQKGREVTVLVTAQPHNDRTRAIAKTLEATDFAVNEDKRPQKILSAVRLDDEPLVLALLIQDDLVSRVNNELKGLRGMIERLPAGSRVMTGYLTSGTIQVRQDFTDDAASAAKSLRILMSSSAGSPYNPYVEVIEAVKMFRTEPAGRRVIVLVSDGLDTSRGFRSASPSLSIDLDRAIAEAQREGIAIYTFYAPSVGLTSFSRLAVNFGQGSLLKIADETGGEAFFSGTDFVSFDPFIRDLERVLGDQWLITYRSDNESEGFRRIEITTDFDLHLQYMAGYRPK